MLISNFPAGGGAKLTGNAQPADVVAGATFYNTNPKEKLTGTGASAKRRATGVSTVSGSGTDFTPRVVTGIGFTPKEVYFFKESTADFLSVNINGVVITWTGSNSRTSGITIQSDGFTYTGDANFYLQKGTAYRWIAYD